MEVLYPAPMRPHALPDGLRASAAPAPHYWVVRSLQGPFPDINAEGEPIGVPSFYGQGSDLWLRPETEKAAR